MVFVQNSAKDNGSSSPAPARRSPAPQPSTNRTSSPAPSANVSGTASPASNTTSSSKREKEEKPAKSSKVSRDSANPSPASVEGEKALSSDRENSASSKKEKKTRRSKETPREQKDSGAATTKGGEGGSFNKPLVKLSMTTLKRTGAPFVQDGPCAELTPKLSKCRECKMTPTQRCKKIPNIFCRFYAFRRLKYNGKGVVTIAGFSELSDADLDDIEPWLPRFPSTHFLSHF